MFAIWNHPFTPLVFTTTGRMGKECLMYHSRLAQLIAIKKGEQYAKTISWIRNRTSFALLRSAFVCLRGSRTRRVPCAIKNVDMGLLVCFLTLNFFFHRSLNLKLHLLFGKLVQKMNSNRFISRLVDQNPIHIIRISALTFI